MCDMRCEQIEPETHPQIRFSHSRRDHREGPCLFLKTLPALREIIDFSNQLLSGAAFHGGAWEAIGKDYWGPD